LRMTSAAPWAKIDTLRVLVPANQTGTVSVAADVMGVYVAVVSLSCTNDTAAAAVQSVTGGDFGAAGGLRVIYSQVGDVPGARECLLLLE